MVASVAMPALIAWQSRRLTAYIAAFAYFGAALWPVVPSAYKFLENQLLLAVGVYLGGVLIVTGLWGRCWGPNRRGAAFRVPAVIVVATIPPFGIIALASLLHASGILFPGGGLAGVVLVTVVAARLTDRPALALTVMAAVSTGTHIQRAPLPPPPTGWTGVDTRLPESRNLLEEYAQHRTLQRLIEAHNATVLVLPESVVSNWTEATEDFWADTFENLRRNGTTVIIGATTPRSASGVYSNMLLVRGADTGVVHQRIPVPIGMLRPFGGVALNLTGPTSISIRGARAAVLICYEQLLPWTLMTAFTRSPGVVIAVSNLSSVEASAVAAQQQAALGAWQSLYGVPVVTAVNR